MILKKTCFITFIILSSFAFTQNDYSYKNIISKLTDSSFHGRGYVNDGDQKAAKYIAEIYEHFDLKKFKSSYFQEFTLGVNTFPNEINLSIGKTNLKLGKDYLINAMSGSASGTFVPISLEYKNVHSQESIDSLIKAHNKKKIYYITPDKYNGDTAQLMQTLPYRLAQLSPVIIIKSDKMMWSVGREAFNHPIIELSDAFLQALQKKQKLSINIKNKYVSDYKSQNVIGYVEGKKDKDQFIIICAHYDHLGRLGQVFFPGGNDNASGTAGMLEMMKYYTKNPHDYSIMFIAFGGEEAGLVGSEYYVNHPLVPLNQTRFVLDLDIMGSADDGITVVNGTKHEKRYNKLVEINLEKHYIPSIKPRKPTQNSDHAPFHKKGVDAFFIYTRGSASKYHETDDNLENLPLVNFKPLVQLLIDFTNSIE